MPRLQVQLKQVSLSDVRRLASVLNVIFSRDPGTSYVFGYPPRSSPDHEAAVTKSYPLRRSMMYRQTCNPDVYVHGAYTPDLKDITGFAIWAPPSGAAELQRRVSPLYRLLGMLIYLKDQLVTFLYPSFLQRILDPAGIAREERKRSMIAADAAIEHEAIPPSIQEQDFWQLIALGVSEEYERRGIGSQLLQWGCDKADETDHAVFIAASQDGEKLYARHGFEVLRRETLLKDVPGAAIYQTYMIRWPKSQREKMASESESGSGSGRESM